MMSTLPVLLSIPHGGTQIPLELSDTGDEPRILGDEQVDGGGVVARMEPHLGLLPILTLAPDHFERVGIGEELGGASVRICIDDCGDNERRGDMYEATGVERCG